MSNLATILAILISDVIMTPTTQVLAYLMLRHQMTAVEALVEASTSFAKDKKRKNNGSFRFASTGMFDRTMASSGSLRSLTTSCGGREGSLSSRFSNKLFMLAMCWALYFKSV